MSYSEQDIKVIYDDVEKIKQSHHMYIGFKGWKAVLHLAKEVIQNSIDEVSAGYGDEIIVMLDEKSKTISVIDFGRGIPLGSIIAVATVIQSSGKFNKGNGKSYKIAAGTHGVNRLAHSLLIAGRNSLSLNY